MLDLLTIGLPQHIWIMKGERLADLGHDLLLSHHQLIVKIQGSQDVVGAEIVDDVLYVYSVVIGFLVTPTAC